MRKFSTLPFAHSSSPALATAVERRKLLHAFMAANLERAGCVSGLKVVLVDDVFTSGTTFSEAARVCLEAGALTFSVIGSARATKPALSDVTALRGWRARCR